VAFERRDPGYLAHHRVEGLFGHGRFIVIARFAEPDLL
jgi:hypothetical protein